MILYFFACTQSTLPQLLEQYALHHQYPPPQNIASDTYVLDVSENEKLSVQHHSKSKTVLVTLHPNLRLSQASTRANSERVISKMIIWNYELHAQSFSINPSSSNILLSTWISVDALSADSLEYQIEALQKSGMHYFPQLEGILVAREP